MTEETTGKSEKHIAGKSVSSRIAIELQRRILAGEIDSNAPLTPERALAKEFEVSRNSVREAIAVLAASGLVSIEHGRGVFVRKNIATSKAPQATKQEFNWQFDGRLSLRDVYQSRLLIEPYAAWMLTHVISRDIISRFDENLRQLADAYAKTELTRASAIDFEFHWMIVAPLGNDIFCDLLKRSASILPASTSNPALEAVAEHKLIIDKMRMGNADDAANAMKEHIVLSAKRAQITLWPM